MVMISMIGFAFFIFSSIAVYSCLVVAGRADDYLEQMAYEKPIDKKEKVTYPKAVQPANTMKLKKKQLKIAQPITQRGASRDVKYLRNSRRATGKK